MTKGTSDACKLRIVLKSVIGLICFHAFSAEIAIAYDGRPNILWITSEDNGIELGCYGDDFATSPNIDALAARGIRFVNCWSNAPVCAPARTTIISGIYATSLGASNMRSRATRPSGTKLLPELLREQGYYCSNNSKEDYNFVETNKPWDDSSNKAHWRNRPKEKPFFSVFNFTTSHESQIRTRPHVAKHDARMVRVPPYHPDLPEVRQDWAQYYDKIEQMDRQVGEILRQLQDDNLADSTIVFYFGDHGSGMPRSKRWLYQSGLHVPMVVVIPEQFRNLRPLDYEAGGADGRLVSFVDLAPTVLKLISAPIPDYLQGIPFAGTTELPNNSYLFGFRDRMDERIDMSRAIRDERFLYIRNFMPYRAQGTFLNYMFQTPTTVAWRNAFREGNLSPHQAFFWEKKPIEELYDLTEDPHQIRNLAKDNSLIETKEHLRDQLKKIMIQTEDLGVIPEAIVKAGRTNPKWDWEEMVESAFFEMDRLPSIKSLESENAVVRFWAGQQLLSSADDSLLADSPALMRMLETLRLDSEIAVQIVALEALAKVGDSQQKSNAVAQLQTISHLNHAGLLNAVAALNSLANLEVEFENVLTLPSKDTSFEPVYYDYIERLKDYLSHKEH